MNKTIMSSLIAGCLALGPATAGNPDTKIDRETKKAEFEAKMAEYKAELEARKGRRNAVSLLGHFPSFASYRQTKRSFPRNA